MRDHLMGWGAPMAAILADEEDFLRLVDWIDHNPRICWVRIWPLGMPRRELERMDTWSRNCNEVSLRQAELLAFRYERHRLPDGTWHPDDERAIRAEELKEKLDAMSLKLGDPGNKRWDCLMRGHERRYQ